jgi:hypothetical protein
MLSKKILVPVLAATTIISTGIAPLTSFAAPKHETKTVQVQVQDQGKGKVKNQDNVDGEVTTQGWKKDALVFALRYGGDFLADLLDILSDKNARLVRQYSDELADALDRYERDIEQRLIDFMIFELDFPSSSARTIAWAIMFIIG